MPNNTEVKRLLDELAAMQVQASEEALKLSDQQLDATVKSGDREQPVRYFLYQMVVHPREHYVHLNKVFRHTGSGIIQPSEAALIVEQAKQSLGALVGLLARANDDDLDKEYDGHSLRKVLEHLKQAHSYYLSRIKKVTQPQP